MNEIRRYIRRILPVAFLLLAGGVMNSVWAAKVTYHILTLPIDPTVYDYHMKSAVTGHRLEAVKIVVDNQTQVGLPAHYKSPLATGFTYYKPEDITSGGSAISLYDDIDKCKGILYDVVASPTPVAVGTEIDGNSAEYYVVYTYNSSNTIAKLDGSVNYNIGVKNKGFLVLNRGRNNRPAVIPTAKADAVMLASEDFSYVESPGNSIGTYWDNKDNKNSRDDTESKFFFGFKFEGVDPYHIIVRTSYAKDTTYIEKNENTNNFVYKWYKGGALMASGEGNAYLASDDHVQYNTPWVQGDPNPTDLSSGYDSKTGYFHGNNCYWSTVALLNNTTSGDGYVLLGTRMVGTDGAVPTPGNDNKYYYLTFTGYNNLNFKKNTAADATKNHTINGIYPIKKVTFKIATPFYDPESPSDDHIVSVADWVSQYTVENEEIKTKYLPASLRRKYCTYTGKFYKDPRCREVDEITTFSDANYDNTEGYQVYVGYQVNVDIPFKAITPAATYNDDTWKGATWYEFIDEGSERIDGLKLKYDGTYFKNNGAYGEFLKTSEYAFIGDPYELRVVLRSATSGASPSYVGATGTPPTSPTDLTASTTESEGYKWELPYDATAGSFLLRKYKGTGNWYWDAGHPSPVDISYNTKAHTYNVATANAQTVTFIVSDLGYTEGDYIKVTAGGTNASQVAVTSENIHVQTDGTATFTAAILGRGDSDKYFTLSIQKYHSNESTDGAASVITVNQESTTYTSNTVQYSTTNSTRVKVLTLPEKSCNFYIVDTYGTIAIKATVSHTVFSPLLGYSSIPEVIRSPFINGETITFYSDAACTSSISETSNTDNYDIYVKYTLAHLAEKNIKLDNTQRFKVNLNKEYIYYNTSDSKIKSTAAVLANDYYSWTLEGGDPYAMRVANVGLSADNIGMFVKVDGGTWGDDKALTFVEGIANGSRFIAMSSLYTGIYEVMAATGTTAYFHIGRPSTSGAETKIYSVNTTGYAHGDETLQFELAGETAVTYHLIDKADNELLTASSYNPRLTLPAEYVSPLVGEYYYYPTRGKATINDPAQRITEISQDTKEDGTQEGGKGDNHVYVTYIANDIVNFNKGQYMLKFLDPLAEGYHLEDGNDKLTSGKIKAVYPYCNGDGNLNVYGDAMQKEQFNGGASTRPRWVWYFDSENSDPYHVTIRSRSTISYNGISNPTYLTTYVVHFNQDAEGVKKVVTGGTLPGVASVEPTEYMVLGTENNYKLMTTNPIPVDLNNDGDTNDEGESNERQKVTSLEQYWKTYNMIKLDVLGILKSTNAYSDDPTTWVVPDDKRAELNTKLDEKGVGSGNWHSYNAYANATRWNGYNDKSDGKEKKVVENLEHWFQTFDMGTGTFDIESADVPPVLVLLDRHGWEIMRRPLPDIDTYPEGEELAGLRVYDSPLVDKYYFYSNATKATGCHKYTMRLQEGKERDQVKVNGERYYSTSLGNLPPKTATGVVSGGAIQDLYVIYTVKEEYENNYAYNLDYTETKDGEGNVTAYTITSETGTSQPYLVLQNGRFYKAENTKAGNMNNSYITKPIFEHTNPEGGNVYDLIVSPRNHGGTNNDIIDGSGNFIGNNFWYVKPNINIDEEMGITWGTAISGAEPLSKVATQVTYKDKSGFDPYNIQLQLVNFNDGNPDGRYLTTHMTSAHLDNGIMVGDYSGTGGTMKITIETAGSATVASGTSEGYDHTDMRITNQTFMAVSDANGNMQLMPRFDHTQRIDLQKDSPWESQLSDPVDHALADVEDNNSMGPQTTFFVNPKRFHYHIIDNYGREALRYKRGADFYPAITKHFMSPLAKDFTYYSGLATKSVTEDSNADAWASATGNFQRTLTDESKLADAVKRLPTTGEYYYKIGTQGPYTYKKVTVTEALIEGSNAGEWGPAGDFKMTLTDVSKLADAVKLLPTAGTYYYRIGTRGNFDYKKVSVTEGLSEKQITGSFAAADVDGVDNDIYVRYEYNLDADLDGDRLLQGQWFTVKLADKDLQADGKVMTFTKTVAESDYASAKTDLTSDGVYYFRIIGASSYTFKKVTKSGGSITDEDSTLDAWTNALGLGVNLYAGSGSLSLTAEDDTEYAIKRDALTAKGVYYFRIGTTEPYSYNMVEVTTVPIASASDYNETLDGDYAAQWSNTKPLVVDADAKKWQWKLFVAPADPISDYYVEPDPYAIHLFNRYSNYTTNPSEEPSPMAAAIKVPNVDEGADRFALLQHPSGGYALVVAKTYSDYNYPFLNGGSMTIPSTIAATTTTEASFNYKTGIISDDALLVLNDDVEYNFTYHVITNAGKLAITASQDKEDAKDHDFAPYLPESAQSPLLNMDDYLYYGFAARPAGNYSVITQTKLYTLSGLYDDNVYVRYNAYDVDKTPFKVPNKRNDTDSDPATTVARNPASNDVSMDINGGLPYNIIWYNDNMMQSTDNSAVSDGGSHSLSGTPDYIWYFTNNDPYALKIKHKGGSYLNGTGTMVAEASAPTFMLLRKDGYDYGILQKTGLTDRLSGHGQTTVTTDPTKYIIFGLSIHKLIYHLIIAKSCPDHDNPETGEYVDIPYSDKNSPLDPNYNSSTGKLRVYGTTQRDLTSVNDGEGTHYAGEKYQLGSTLSWNNPVEYHTYSYDAGAVSIGDSLVLPTVFYRPNCLFDFYIEGIYQHYAEANVNEGKPLESMESKYKGLKLSKLMSDEGLIDQDVVVNVVYRFNPGLETNAGDGFVTEMKPAGTHYLWYTFETADVTPQLAHYTHVRGMRAESGRALRYTNDYLWSPLGDVYGFRMYNRYIYKNNGQSTHVLTTASIADGQEVVMGAIATNDNRGIYELLQSSTPGSGTFRVHPLLEYPNNTIFLTVDEREGENKGKLILSDGDPVPIKEWTYGLSTELLNPYYQGAGNVGGLTTMPKAGQEKSGKARYEEALADEDVFRRIRRLQRICYNKDSIVDYAPGYYRLCNQPGASSLSTQRYASGYLHDIEKTAGDESTAIPMHFYSKVGVTGTFNGDINPLKSGFTETAATRGDIPVPATEYDPSTVFYFSGDAAVAPTIPTSTIQTQGLYVMGVETDASHGYTKMTTTSGSATSFNVDDIGGAVVILYNVDNTSHRHYINYYQKDDHIYDLHYYENVDVDGSKWCMEPANTQGLKVATNNGGDGYYYATFYAPFDVQLPADGGGKTYNAYVCKAWDNTGLHPTAVPAASVNEVNYAEGKFVPAGTPVIIRTSDESNSVTLSIPSSSPTASSITTDLKGEYLEQLLAADASRDVYTFGLYLTSDGEITIDRETGVVTASRVESATSGVGFYINATPNKEHHQLQARWQRNNFYVLHNKIYYRAPAPSPAPDRTRDIQFVPVIFDDDEGGEEEPGGQEEENLNNRRVGDGCVYDILGRKVASAEEVKAGTWYRHLSPGVYIVNGQKVFVGVGRM